MMNDNANDIKPNAPNAPFKVMSSDMKPIKAGPKIKAPYPQVEIDDTAAMTGMLCCFPASEMQIGIILARANPKTMKQA